MRGVKVLLGCILGLAILAISVGVLAAISPAACNFERSVTWAEVIVTLALVYLLRASFWVARRRRGSRALRSAN
jgi:hypothetical protein